MSVVNKCKSRVSVEADGNSTHTKLMRSNLNFCLWNAQSVNNKLEVVQDYCNEHNLDIMLLTECWLKDDDIAAIGQLENRGEYKLWTKPRSHRVGGGVGCLYKSSMKMKKLDTPRTITFEHLALNLVEGHKSVIILLVYRPESSVVNRYSLSEFSDEFTELVSQFHGRNQELLIAGDFNFHVNKPGNSKARKFKDILQMFDLVQHIKGPTHKAGNTLDLVITRKDSDLLKSCRVDELLSDHYTILMEVDITRPIPDKKSIKFRKTRSIDMNSFKKDLNFHISKFNQINKHLGLPYLESLVNIYESCVNVLDKHAPIQERIITVRKPTPWNTVDIKAAKIAKRKAEKKWRKTKNCVDYDNFKAKRNEYNIILKELRSKHLAEKINKCKGNSKALFKVVNSALNRKPESPLPHNIDDMSLASEFSKFFDNKIQTIRSKLHENHDPIRCSFKGTQFTQFTKVEPDMIRKLINRMATKHSDLDPLPTWLVKECLDILLPIITEIVNTSLNLGVMPQRYKHAIIKPLLKKNGLELKPQNYRPISNLSFISKIIEGVVIEQLNKHLSNNALQDPRQSAYKPNHSTETLLTKIHNDIMINGDKGKITMLVLLDLSAAFDTIDHKILLDRLEHTYGIKNSPLDWFKSYLTGRTNAVTVNNCVSGKRELKYGVPQGSKLGPVLFNTYIAPMSDIAKIHRIDDQKYADDEQLILSFNPTDDDASRGRIQMEKCIDDIRSFLSKNKLCNNGSKTEIILFGSKTQLSSIHADKLTVDGVEISYSDDAKNLGVIFDKHMTMEKQINKICKSAYFNIKNISHIRNNLSKEDAKTVVNALVTPHFDYGNCLLYGISKKLLNKLQVAQNSAVRLIEKLRKHDHITVRRKELHWLPIEARIKYKLLMLTWKAINGQAPDYLRDLIRPKATVRALRSNDTNLLSINNINANSWGRRSFEITSPNLWNNLPKKVRTIKKLETFKRSLKTHLFKIHYNE